MRAILASALAAALLCAGAVAAPNPAQDANQGVVGVITGMDGGTYLKTAADLTILDDGTLRVLPIIGKGSLQNLSDILYLRGVDIGFVQSDVLSYAKQHHLFHDLDRVQYIMALYQEEVHVLSGPDIHSLSDLDGKTVSVDVLGSGSAMTAEIIMAALHIQINVEHSNTLDALAELQNGQIAAVIHVGGEPIPIYAEIPAGTGLHFLSVPLSDDLMRIYLPAELTRDQYPNLVGDDAVPTIAVPDVMAVYGWTQGSARYNKVDRFVRDFFDRFKEFQQPPRHPKWREVSLIQDVPGWTRFQSAKDWLSEASTDDRPVTEKEFRAFLAAKRHPKKDPQTAKDLVRQIHTWERESGYSPPIQMQPEPWPSN